MEYLLNKVDTNVIQDINDYTREGKIHSKQSLEVNSEELKDKKKWNNSEKENDDKKSPNISKYVKGQKAIVVKVYKFKTIEVGAEKEKDDNYVKGMFIDIRK